MSQTPRKNIVFIDNAKEFWKNDMDMYSKSVDYIQVSNADANREKSYTDDLAKSGNQYALNVLQTDERKRLDRGVDNKIANALKSWSTCKSDKQKYALFDWDGTVTAVEGMSIDSITLAANQPRDAFNNDGRKLSGETSSMLFDRQIPERSMSVGIAQIHLVGGAKTSSKTKKRGYRVVGSGIKKGKRKKQTAKNYNDYVRNVITSSKYEQSIERPLNLPSKEFLDDMFIYIMKPSRTQMMRDLFRTLLQNGVQIHILTQNPYASVTNPFRKIFIEMIWRLFNEISSNESSEQYKQKDGRSVSIYKSSSHIEMTLSREEINKMLHSTMDYTTQKESYLKRNVMRRLRITDNPIQH